MRRRPEHLKLIANTSRPDRVAPATAGVLATDTIPPPPAWMHDTNALAEWHRIVKILHACRLLNEGTALILPNFCMLHSRFVTAWTTGECPSGTLLSVYRKLYADLGLSTAATPAPGTTPNRFSRNAPKRR